MKTLRILLALLLVTQPILADELRVNQPAEVTVGSLVDPATFDNENSLTVEDLSVVLYKPNGDMYDIAPVSGIPTPATNERQMLYNGKADGTYTLYLLSDDTEAAGSGKLTVNGTEIAPYFSQLRILDDNWYLAKYSTEAMNSQLTAASRQAVADDVWNEDIVADHGTLNSAGRSLSALGYRSETLTNMNNGSILAQSLAKVDMANYDRDAMSQEALSEGTGGGADPAEVAQAVWQYDLDTPTPTLPEAGAYVRQIDSKIDGLGAGGGGGSFSVPVDGDNTAAPIQGVTFVGDQGGTDYTATEVQDGNYHTITHTGSVIDLVYEFQVGGGATAADLMLDFSVGANGSSVAVQVYDFAGAAWDTLETVSGSNQRPQVSYVIPLLSRHTGTGGDSGRVLCRFLGSSITDMNIDRAWAQAVITGQSVGYANGAIWLDTNSGNTSVVPFVDGTADNPAGSLADARTIGDSVGISRIQVSSDSSIVLDQEYDSWEFKGVAYDMDVNGQSIDDAAIIGAVLEGAWLGEPTFGGCRVRSMQGAYGLFADCIFDAATITLNASGELYIVNGSSRVADAAYVTIDFGAAVTNSLVSIRGFSGSLNVENLGSNGTDDCNVGGSGTIRLNESCDGGNVELDGSFALLDASGGGGGGAVTIYNEANNNQTIRLANNQSTIEANHLHFLFAADYNPALAPGVPGAWINELSEDDGAGNIRYTLKALEEAPGGAGSTTANLTQIMGQPLTETLVGQLAAGFSHFYDVAVPTKTMNDVGVAGAGLTKQDVRDSMLLPPTAGPVDPDSIDTKIDSVVPQVDNLLTTYQLHRMFANTISDVHVANNSFAAKLVDKGAVASFTNYDWQLHSLRAIADNTVNSGDATLANQAEILNRIGTPTGSLTDMLSTQDTQLASIKTDTLSIIATLGVNGGGLTAIPWNGTAWNPQVLSQVTAGLEDMHLQYVFKEVFNPALPPGSALSYNNRLSENDGAGNLRFTAKALETAIIEIDQLEQDVIDIKAKTDLLPPDTDDRMATLPTTGSVAYTGNASLFRSDATLANQTETLDRLGDPGGGNTIWSTLQFTSNNVQDLQTQIGNAGSGLTLVPWNNAWNQEIVDQTTNAMVALNLHHLGSAGYDPATPPWAGGSYLDRMTEYDGVNQTRYTAKALERAPTGTGGGSVTVEAFTPGALAEMFTIDTGETVGTAVDGSVVNESAGIGDPDVIRSADPTLLVQSVVQAKVSNNQFIIAAGPPDDQAMYECSVYIINDADETQTGHGRVVMYNGTTREIIMDRDSVYNFSVNDKVLIMRPQVPAPKDIIIELPPN